MGKIITSVLPHDLPENWTDNQYVTPGGTEAGLSEQHGFNYLMKQVNNTQKAVNELDESSASSYLTKDRQDLNQVSQFSPIVLGWFNSMADEQVKNFLLRIYIEGSPLEGGEWRLTITRITEAIGTIVAIKQQADVTVGGVIVKTCSIINKNFTSWKEAPHIDRVVSKSGDTITGNLTIDGHVTMKGNNRAFRFEDSTDRTAFLEKSSLPASEFGIYNSKDTNNRSALVLAPETATENNLLSLFTFVDGALVQRNVIHTGNLAHYLGVTPASLE